MRSLRPLLPALLLAAWSACAGSARPGLGGPALGRDLVETARRQSGVRYRFGGRSPENGFDCSGLAWWAYSRHGIRIPATSAQQFKGGRKVRRKGLLPGDLVFFAIDRRGPSHVGIYTGRGTFIHAPKDGSRVREELLAESYWERRYIGARRYLPE